MLLIISLKFQVSFVSIKEINLLSNMRYFWGGFICCLVFVFFIWKSSQIDHSHILWLLRFCVMLKNACPRAGVQNMFSWVFFRYLFHVQSL